MRLGAGAVQDAVADAHGVRAPVLPAEALAVEDVEELLLVGVHVDRHGALPRGDPVAAEPGACCAGRRAEAPARPAQLRPVDDAGLDLVGVDDHPAPQPSRTIRAWACGKEIEAALGATDGA